MAGSQPQLGGRVEEWLPDEESQPSTASKRKEQRGGEGGKKIWREQEGGRQKEGEEGLKAKIGAEAAGKPGPTPR